MGWRAVAVMAIVGAATVGVLTLSGPTRAQTYEFAERYQDGDAARGAKLYKRYCRGCHGVDGRGGAHTFMPHINNLTKRDYIESIPDSFLFEAIAEGGEAIGKSAYMPSWKSTLSEQDIKDVIAHIRSLPMFE
jgi:mono/diheme cytochrome c family protein